MHILKTDLERGFIEVTVLGMWDEDGFDTFIVELRTAIAAAPASAKPTMTLYNYTGAFIQTQAVVAKMLALAEHPGMLDRRVALYTDGCLARQQAKRIAAGRPNMRVFDHRDAALAYLLDNGEESAPLRARMARG